MTFFPEGRRLQQEDSRYSITYEVEKYNTQGGAGMIFEHRESLFLAFLLGGVLLLAASSASAADNAGNASPRQRLASARTWGYWLQAPDLNALGRAGLDLVVVDYSRTGRDEDRFTREEIAGLRDAGTLVLAYFSVGEAETYRFYWEERWTDDPPGFLGPENPDWPGNFKVRYWKRSWWTVLKAYLDRIAEAGFDGVYLDIVDAYWFWGSQDDSLTMRADDMVRLIGRVAKYGRKAAGRDFLVVMQNGLGIVEHASESRQRDLLASIDGVGVESLFFNTTAEDAAYRIRLLARYAEHGSKLMNVEYVPAADMERYCVDARGTGLPMLLYRADPDRMLDELVPQK